MKDTSLATVPLILPEDHRILSEKSEKTRKFQREWTTRPDLSTYFKVKLLYMQRMTESIKIS